MKRLIIVHGYDGQPGDNWLPWLQAKLEAEGVSVMVPAMPNPNAPQLDEWLPRLQQVVGEPNEDTFLIGHSLGCATILRYLESLEDGQKIGGVVLVAAFAEPIQIKQLDSFTAGSWNDDHIKRVVGTVVVINSDDDPYVPLSMGKAIRDRLSAKLVVLHGAGHISEEADYFELPVAYDELRIMMELS